VSQFSDLCGEDIKRAITDSVLGETTWDVMVNNKSVTENALEKNLQRFAPATTAKRKINRCLILWKKITAH